MYVSVNFKQDHISAFVGRLLALTYSRFIYLRMV